MPPKQKWVLDEGPCVALDQPSSSPAMFCLIWCQAPASRVGWCQASFCENAVKRETHSFTSECTLSRSTVETYTDRMDVGARTI
jgi:hypothetical protein